MILVGTFFGAIRVPEAIVHAAVESTDAEEIDFVLSDRLDGPVIHDGRGRNYYMLINPEARLDWGTSAPGVEFLPPGTYLGVPAVNLFHYTPQTPVYWTVPGVTPGHCDSAAVALLIRVGAARLAEAVA
ncbi:hypothetical protein AB0I68_38590 [Streptomyces sp. NPDC050448]|uniref:hypothetical protein n=1 Tax=Streptomyces sp. NPDC050448 TaxID=3155404 RepID=UPI00341B002B